MKSELRQSSSSETSSTRQGRTASGVRYGSWARYRIPKPAIFSAVSRAIFPKPTNPSVCSRMRRTGPIASTAGGRLQPWRRNASIWCGSRRAQAMRSMTAWSETSSMQNRGLLATRTPWWVAAPTSTRS